MESIVNVVQSDLNTAPEQFPYVCRLCLKTHNIQPIFKLKYKDFSFHRIFESCSFVQIKEGDELPQNVCFLCVNEVVRFYTFILKTQECDKLLKASLSKQAEIELIQTAEEVPVVKQEVVDVVEVENVQIDIKPTDIEEKVQVERNGKVKTESANKDVNSKTLTILKTSDTQLQQIVALKHPSQIPRNKLKTTKKRVRKSRWIRRTQIFQKKVQTFSCLTCGDSFPSMRLLIRHYRTEGDLSDCPTCQKRFCNTTMLKRHMMTHMEERPFVCSVCGARFPLEDLLQAHLKIHSGEKPHLCEVCGRGFIKKQTLIDHRNRHTEITPYTCLQCDRQFSSNRSLCLHKRTHSPKKLRIQTSLKCKECGKTYAHKASLYRHTKIHKGIKSYKCEICAKTFTHWQSLKSHTFTHTDERPFVCELCDKAFTQQAHLRYHALTHSGEKPYVCKVCGKGFKQKAHLTYHARMHSGEKPYSCTFCEKSFALKSTCKVHVRTHTGEKPHVCDVCKKGFCDSSSMNKHRRRHYKN